jgi:putative ABC transport system permease protein
MNIALLKGRAFTEHDSTDTTPVTIVDENLARQYWPNQDPIGKRLAFFFESSQDQLYWREVVGVVGNVKHYGLDGQAKIHVYLPYLQRSTPNMSLVARTSTDPAGMTSAIRNTVLEVDPDQPIYGIRTMEEVVSNSVAPQRLSTILLAIFAGVAMLLAAVGIYGVMSYSINQRTHEIGIRMALGARRSDVIRLVVGQGMLLAIMGVVVGLIGGFFITRVMSTLLFGVEARDPMTFAVIPALLVSVALVACYLPARRATRVDPMVALRYE